MATDPGDFEPAAQMVTARLTITRYLNAEGRDLVHVDSDNLNDGDLPVIEALGMLALAEYDVMHRPALDEE